VEKFFGFFILVFGWGTEWVEALKGFLFSPKSATAGSVLRSNCPSPIEHALPHVLRPRGLWGEAVLVSNEHV
jgi:hypothetical protein